MMMVGSVEAVGEQWVGWQVDLIEPDVLYQIDFQKDIQYLL